MTMPQYPAHAPRRWCETRKTDACYLEVGLSPFGEPFESFLIDPPQPLPAGMNATNLANKNTLWQDPATHIWHILIWIGAQYYKYLPDFLEEARQWGLSRRVQSTLDFEKLEPGKSQMILIHPKAIITNWRDLITPVSCLQAKTDHSLMTMTTQPDDFTLPTHPVAGSCLDKLSDLIPADDGKMSLDMTLQTERDARGYGVYLRHGGDTTYAFTPTAEIGITQPGIFAAFFPTNIALITQANGQLGPKMTRLQEKLDQLAGLPYRITDS